MESSKNNLEINNIKSLSLYQLIGAPLHALVQAEAQAMQSTLDYIKELGFERSPNEPNIKNTSGDAVNNSQETGTNSDKEVGQFGRIRMVTFLHDQINTNGNSSKVQISIPLLSLIPIPMLSVKQAEIEFSLKVADFNYEKDIDKDNPSVINKENGDESFASADDLYYLSNKRAGIRATMGTMGKVAENTSQYQIRVKMNIEQSDMPAGLGKLLSTVSQNIITKPIDTK